ncbi:MAG: DUF6094 domain-containing protein [Oscillospiraceae bacterium]
MSEQLDRSEGRYYAIERLSQLQKEIIHLLQGMVIQRARVEKYRQGDLASARDTYSELQRTRRQLCQSIADARSRSSWRRKSTGRRPLRKSYGPDFPALTS